MEENKERKKRPIHEVGQRTIEENVNNSPYSTEDKIILKSFATRLNKEMKKQNIIQENFWGEVGISEGALSNYRNGKRFPDSNVLVKMAKSLNCSTDYLLGLSDLKSPNEDFKTVHILTGLSDKAIIFLNNTLRNKEALANTTDIDHITTINYLLENELNYSFLLLLTQFLWSNITIKETARTFSFEYADGTIEQKKISGNEKKMNQSLAKVDIDRALFEMASNIENQHKTAKDKSIKN